MCPPVPPCAPGCQRIPLDDDGNKKPAKPCSYAGFRTSLYNLRHVLGGEEEDRTPDLRIANATLSQLSYPPNILAIIHNLHPGWQATSEKFLRPRQRHQGFAKAPAQFDGAPASTHLTTDLMSASLMPGWAGIGITPHTPEPPSRIFFASLSAAAGSFL